MGGGGGLERERIGGEQNSVVKIINIFQKLKQDYN